MTGERLTRNQLGCLDEVYFHGHLTAGWGGYSFRTMNSLAHRGFLSTSIADDRRFSLTAKGYDALKESWAREARASS